MLEPHVHNGKQIYAVNMDLVGKEYYWDYVLSIKESYASKLLEGGKSMSITSVA